jgi:hypothetical protein
MPAVLDPQAEHYLTVLKALPEDEQQLVIQALERVSPQNRQPDARADEVAAAIAGRSFSRHERLQLEMDTLAQHFTHRRQLLSDALTAPQVAQLLGTSRQTPHDRVASQTLLAIKDNGALRFPTWQFDPSGSDGVVEGLPEVLKALQMSDYAKLNWLTRNNPYLEGQAPIQLLKQGARASVLQAAADAGAGQWS